MTVEELIKDLRIHNTGNYKVLLAGGLSAKEDGVILSVYPDHKKRVMWIDVCDENDDTL
jgi:hypothetical protein